MSDLEEQNLIYGLHTSNAQLKSNPKAISKIYIKKHPHNSQLKNILELANKTNILIDFVDRDFLSTISQSNKHQGVVCQLVKNDSSEFDLDRYLQIDKKPFIVIFDSIQDPGNLGSCIRSANAAGVTLIVKKKSNSCAISPIVHKASSGGLQGLSLYETNNLSLLIKKLKNHNISIIGTDHAADESIYQMSQIKSGVAVIIGSEGSGIAKSLLKLCDNVYKIPIYGSVECLNVSVATGITLYQTNICLKKIK